MKRELGIAWLNAVVATLDLVVMLMITWFLLPRIDDSVEEIEKAVAYSLKNYQQVRANNKLLIENGLIMQEFTERLKQMQITSLGEKHLAISMEAHKKTHALLVELIKKMEAK